MLRKGTMALLFAILMTSCFNNTPKQYDEEFYKPLPYEGMKGNVESVTSSMYISTSFNSSDAERKSYFFQYFFDVKGRVDSIFGIEYEEEDSIMSSIKQIWNEDYLEKIIDKRWNSKKEKMLEMTFQHDDKENFTILTRDLLDSTNVIPNGSTKINFAKKSMTVASISISLKEEDNIKSSTQYYQDRRVIKSEMRDGNGLTITHTSYNNDGNVKENRYINNADKSPKKANNTFEYLETDKQGNYTLARSTYRGNDSDVEIFFRETREITYRD